MESISRFESTRKPYQPDLSKGYATVTATRAGSFLYILARIPDITLCEMDREHAEESANHQAILAMYRARVAAEKKGPEPSEFEKICAKAAQ